MGKARGKLNFKQDQFAFYLFQGCTQRDAFIKAYKPPQPLKLAQIDTSASRIARRAEVNERLHELRAEVAQRLIDEKVMSEQERREVLTKIGRAKIGDFVNEAGDVDLSKPEAMNSPAVGGIKKTVWQGGKGGQASSETVHITVRDPIAAVKELNLMDQLYSGAAAFIRDEHKEINIFVIDDKAKKLLARVRERTGKLITGPGTGGDDGTGNDSGNSS